MKKWLTRCFLPAGLCLAIAGCLTYNQGKQMVLAVYPNAIFFECHDENCESGYYTDPDRADEVKQKHKYMFLNPNYPENRCDSMMVDISTEKANVALDSRLLGYASMAACDSAAFEKDVAEEIKILTDEINKQKRIIEDFDSLNCYGDY